MGHDPGVTSARDRGRKEGEGQAEVTPGAQGRAVEGAAGGQLEDQVVREHLVLYGNG